MIRPATSHRRSRFRFRSRLARLVRGPSGPETFARLIEDGVVTVGPGTYGAFDVHAYALGIAELPAIRIGGYCSIGPGACAVVNGGHHHNSASTFPFQAVYGTGSRHEKVLDGPMTIGSDVWIGARALLIGAVSVGHGAVIGGGAVVTKDIRPYAIVAGNPATEIRRRFDDATVEQLLALRWWDLPEHQVIALADSLAAPVDTAALAERLRELPRRGLSQAE